MNQGLHLYFPLPGLCWDIVNCNDPEIQDDPLLDDYNVDDVVARNVEQARIQAAAYVGDIYYTMGFAGTRHETPPPPPPPPFLPNLTQTPSPRCRTLTTRQVLTRPAARHPSPGPLLTCTRHPAPPNPANAGPHSKPAQYAEEWFTNLDKLIHYTNLGTQNHGMRVHTYSRRCTLQTRPYPNPAFSAATRT